MRRNVAVFLTILLCMLPLLCSIPASAGSKSEILLYDEGSRLSAEETTQLENRMQQAADYTGLNIGIVLGTQSRSDTTIEAAVKSTYTETFGNDSDGLIYYMDLKGYEAYDYIATRGLAMFYITNDVVYNRLDQIYDALDSYLVPAGSEDVFGASMAFCEQVEKCYDAGIPEHFYVYDDVNREYYHIEGDQMIATAGKPWKDWGAIAAVTMIGGVIGLLAALITFGAVKAHYKFKYELSPTTYINRKEVQVNQQYDRFVRKNVTRVPLNTDSGGGRSGGGGGGGFSSGGFGGGGHHR